MVDDVMDDLVVPSMNDAVSKEKIDSLNTLAWSLRDQDSQRAYELAQEALELLDSDSVDSEFYPQGRADTLRTLARMNGRFSHYDLSLKQAMEGLAICEEIGYQTPLSQLLDSIAFAYRRMGNLSGSLDYYYRELKHSEAAGDDRGRARALTGIGVINSDRGASAEALSSFAPALEIFRALDNAYWQAVVLNNISYNYFQLKDIDMALQHGLESLMITRENGLLFVECVVRNTLAESYLYQENYEHSLMHLKKVMVLAAEHNYRALLLESMKLSSQLYMVTDTEKAIPLLKQALELAQEIEHLQFLYESHQLLAQIYKAQGDFALALHHFEQFHTIREQVYNEESTQKMQNLAILQETEKTQQEAAYYASLYEQEQARRQLAEVLNQVGQTLTGSLDLSDVLVNILEQLEKLVAYDRGALLRWRETEMEFVAARGYDTPRAIEEYRIPVNMDNEMDVFLRIHHNNEPLNIPDVANYPVWHHVDDIPAPGSWLGVPLIREGMVIGMLSLAREATDPYEDEAITLATTFANQAAIALENAQLYQQTVEINAQLEIEMGKRTEAMRQLAKMNADKDRFFSIISHDLRGPFNPVMGFSKLLMKRAHKMSTEDIADTALAIYESSEQVYDLLENLLQWSRMQTGRMVYEPGQVLLAELIKQTMSLLQGSAQHKKIDLQTEFDETLMIYADTDMIYTVIRNLVSNAIKFTPEGGKVSLKAMGGEDEVEVQVVDNGVGMSAEDIEKLFRLDVQFSTKGTMNEKGTGLGLIMCHELVAQHNGRIWVESVVGEGTTFKFTIPRHEKKVSPA